MANPLLPLMKNLLIEWPAARRSYRRLGDELERDGAKLEARFSAAPDTPANREHIRHIVGIERWGQRRLRVALGELPVYDEMNGYLPRAAAPVAELNLDFGAARSETVVIARQLEVRHISPKTRVDHNQFGALTVRGWLVYLRFHANVEGGRVK
jgi:hypothetical protein